MELWVSLSAPRPVFGIAPRISSPVGRPVTLCPSSQPRAKAQKQSWLDGFRRVTSNGDFIPEIDGLRFIAISLVIVCHLSVLIGFWLLQEEGLLKYGRHGVELFFGISGFILATPFAMQAIRDGKRVSLKRYFLRRVTRLEPPYLLSLVIYFMLKRMMLPGTVRWSDLLTSSFYISGLTNGTFPRISTVCWSLEVEIQFYLLMPLLGMLYWIGNRWIRRACLVGLAAVCVGVGPVAIPGFATGLRFDHNVLTYLPYFLCGLALADVFATEWQGAAPALKTRGFKWGDFVWLTAWPVLLWVFIQENTITRAAAPVIIFALYFSLFHSVWPRKILRCKLLTVIGGMCYSIYLMHNIVLEGSLRVLHPYMPHNFNIAMVILSAVAVPATLVLCGAYFRLIEKPCMRPDWPARLKGWVHSRGTAAGPCKGCRAGI